MTRVLAVRLDSDGDVLLTGPALRLLRRDVERLDLLCSSSGAAAARLLPDVDDVLVDDVGWCGFDPPPVDATSVTALVQRLRERGYDEAVVFTSYHQSPLPTALLLRLAGIGRVAGTSDDHPGTLLDVRHRRRAGAAGAPVPDDDDGGADGGHEVEAACALVAATGRPTGPGGPGPLAVRRPLPDVTALLPERHVLRQAQDTASTGSGQRPSTGSGHRPSTGSGQRFVVLHPGASVPSRSMSAGHARALARVLTAAGWTVLVTGTAAERELTAAVCLDPSFEVSPRPGERGDTSNQRSGPVATAGGGWSGRLVDLAGRTTLAELAAVLAAASCVVVGNTGPAHLAAAVGTPVVSLFAPVVPAERWAPWGVPSVLLGDQRAGCRGTRARSCPLPRHSCLDDVAPERVVDAVRTLAGAPPAGAPPARVPAEVVR